VKALAGKKEEEPRQIISKYLNQLLHWFRVNSELFKLAVFMKFVIKSLNRDSQVISRLGFIATKMGQCFQDISFL